MSADLLLEDCLVAENAQFQPEGNSALLTSERASPISGSKMNISTPGSHETPTKVVGQPESPSFGNMRYCYCLVLIYHIHLKFMILARCKRNINP